MSGPAKEVVQALYSNTLRTAQSFSSYNFRKYFVQRTYDKFRTVEAEQDPTKLNNFMEEMKSELEVLKRAAVINQMYGGRKLVVETNEEAPTPEKPLQRSDN
jgi:LYR motif-containing protein 4